MHILVTNDDGVHAPGILALAQAMREVGDVSVVAPHENQSAAGHRLTFHKPLRADPVKMADGSPAVAVNGSPADCVALAFLGLIKPQVDVVASGINTTWNLAQDVTTSGTVAAAMHAAISSVPAIAVSSNYGGETYYETGAAFAAQLAVRVGDRGLPRHSLLNVNVPDLRHDKIAGVMVTRQGTRIYPDKLVVREDPRGNPYYWIGGDAPTGVLDEEGTDFWALENGYISVTPLNLDMTAHGFIAELNSWDLNPTG